MYHKQASKSMKTVVRLFVSFNVLWLEIQQTEGKLDLAFKTMKDLHV